MNEDLNKRIQELFIRFNTSPKLYQKADYLSLLKVLKLIKSDLSDINDSVDSKISELNQFIGSELNSFEQNVDNKINTVVNNIEPIIDNKISHVDFQSYVDRALENKTFNIFAGVVNPDGGMKLNIIVDENGKARFIQL